MKRILLLILSFIFLINLSAIVIESGSFRNFLYGVEPNAAYDDYVSHISEGIADPDYNLYAPFDPQTNGFGDFDIPNTAELSDWVTIIQEFTSANYTSADTLISNGGYPYEVVRFTDTDTGARYFMMRETLNMTYFDDNFDGDPNDDVTGSFDKGWGLFLYNPTASKPIVITIPHPTDDYATAIMGFECFKKWDAMFLLINGTGREVSWTNVGNYYNSKALGDPTRNANTVFHKAYMGFCDHIRSSFGVREFSVQLHSYDWGTRHPGLANNQISGGKYEENLGLPSLDPSNRHLDLINASDEVIFPANTIGVHEEVTLNGYYTFHNTVYDYYYYTDDGDSILVNTDQDLPGYSDNRQTQYTNDNSFNEWDVYDNFWHIEMDELPNQYDQTNNNYKWFYGWDPIAEVYDQSAIFDHTLEYYSYWVDKMTEVLPAVFDMDDSQLVATPENLDVFSQSYNYITLQWDDVPAFDFATYEILYATEPIGDDNYSIYDRSNYEVLADQKRTLLDVGELSQNQLYYFKIRALDKNGNVSGLSNEISAVTGCAKIRYISSIGRDGAVELGWQSEYENDAQGYRVYRSDDNENYAEIASWVFNGELVAANSNNSWYSFTDTTPVNNVTYYYKIAAVDNSDVEFIHNYETVAEPYDIYRIHVSNALDDISDDITFGMNLEAGDGEDGDYDVRRTTTTSGDYVYVGFWEEDWYYDPGYGVNLSQHIKTKFDTTKDWKGYYFRVKSNQTNEDLTMSLEDYLPFRSTEKIWIYDMGNGSWTSLLDGDYTFQVTNTNYRNFYVYYGNLNPYFEINNRQNHIFQGGQICDLYWNNTRTFLLDHIEISLQSEADSVFVADDLTNEDEFIMWTVPENIEYHNLRLYVDGIAQDGERIREKSPYIIGLVPSTIDITRTAGWHTVASPFPNDDLLDTEAFGAGAELWEYNSVGDLLQANDFEYENAYWAYVPNGNTASIQATVASEYDEFDLDYGWNFIVNPFAAEITMQNCLFRINNVWFSAAEAVNELNLNPNIFVYRDGMYQNVSNVLPFESYFLYCLTDDVANPRIRVYPYSEALPLEQPLTSLWNLKIFTDNGIDKSYVEIGSAWETTADYDLNYDLPALQNKPIPERLDFALYHSTIVEPNYPFEFMMRELTVPFDTDVDTSFVWEYMLKLGSTDPIQIYPDLSLFDANFTIRINISGDDFYLHDEQSITYQPSSTRDIFGEIEVYNYTVGNDETPAVANVFSIYPNPFNPDTNIAFNVKKLGKVELSLYNIRGQKITTLVREEMKPGNHTVIWNGEDKHGRTVASGVYFARLKTTGSKTQIKKMMLMK